MTTPTGCRLRENDLPRGGFMGIHTLFVEDIVSFLDREPADWSDLQWHWRNIDRVMREFRLTGDSQHHPVLAVGAPKLSIEDVFTRQFETAFNYWLSMQRENGLDANFVVVTYGARETRSFLVRPSRPGARLVEIRIYTREFFEGHSEPWMTIMQDLDLGLHFGTWRHDPALTLRDRFDYGDAYGFTDDPRCVALLSAVTGSNHQLEVGTPYFVPAPPVAYTDVEDDEEEGGPSCDVGVDGDERYF